MKIKSIIDVITNSSTEVFLMKRDKKYFKLLKKYGVKDNFLHVDSEQELKELILLGIKKCEESNNQWDDIYWDICTFMDDVLDLSEWGSYGDTFLHQLGFWKALREAGRTDEEIIDFFMPVFKPLIGVSYFSFQDDCGRLDPNLEAMLYEGGYFTTRR